LIEYLLHDPARALELLAHEIEPPLSRNLDSVMAEGVGGVHALRVEWIEGTDPIRLLMQLERAVNVEGMLLEMKGGHISAEEALELLRRPEYELTHGRMDAVGTEDEIETLACAIREANLDIGGARAAMLVPTRMDTLAASARR
jgi:hypothetical protein